jgi:predicted acetyltransferase
VSFEVRNITADEIAQAELIAAQAFGSRTRHENEQRAERAERARQSFSPDWYLCAFEDGEMTSMMRTLPAEMYINGAALGFGAVSPVANSPLHRRKGHSGVMLRRSLEQMRERGQVLSGLYTPHPSFYRRYGWEIASDWRVYSFAPKDLRLDIKPSQRGRFRFLRADDWQSLAPVYDRYAIAGNGTLRRPEYWWRSYVADTPWRPGTDVVLWQNDAGEPEGYGIYQQPARPGPGYEQISIDVRELVAVSRDAYLNLWAYFGRHDIHHEVSIAVSPHEPVLSVVADAERLEVKQGYAVLLRVVDFEAAIRSRPPARADETCTLLIRLIDDSAPWNDGTWRIGVSEGKTWAERTDGDPELTMTSRVLAPLFNGYLTPDSAHLGGLLEAKSDDALLRAGRIFAVTQPPFFLDHF